MGRSPKGFPMGFCGTGNFGHLVGGLPPGNNDKFCLTSIDSHFLPRKDPAGITGWPVSSQ